MKNKHRGLSFAISSALTVCLLVIIPIRQVDGQSGMEAYERGALSQVEAYLSRGAADSVEAEFLRAALTADAENAVENYRRIVLQHPESPFSKRALYRIYEYYYALGIYGRAEEFEKALDGFSPPVRRLRLPDPTIPPQAQPPGERSAADSLTGGKLTDVQSQKPSVFSLQVGAFSSRFNAEKLRNELVKSGYTVEILDASNTKNHLHAVRVIGYYDEYAARCAAEELQRKFGCQTILIKKNAESDSGNSH